MRGNMGDQAGACLKAPAKPRELLVHCSARGWKHRSMKEVLDVVSSHQQSQQRPQDGHEEETNVSRTRAAGRNSAQKSVSPGHSMLRGVRLAGVRAAVGSQIPRTCPMFLSGKAAVNESWTELPRAPLYP